MPITSDSTIYFITDRPARSSKIGLCVMDTPTHGPLASTFGRQLLDMGSMPEADTTTYAQAMMEMLVKSDASTAKKLSPAGRSALTDWFAVMAIEDYRGVSFGNPDLGWGYNMTNVQFYGLCVRALARSGTKDSKGNPVIGQCVVGTNLQPGDPSYADVLNGGNDMQEFPDMQQQKKLTTDYLTQAHPDLVNAVHDAFKGIVPDSELDDRAKSDVFHYICANLYDAKERMTVLTGARAEAAVKAVVALVSAMEKDSEQLEAYLLAHGLTKSNDPAPKSKGF
jgi:hypothetical protein